MLEIWLPTAADRVGAMEGWAPAWAVVALLGIIRWSPDRRKSKQEWTRKTQIDDTRASSDAPT